MDPQLCPLHHIPFNGVCPVCEDRSGYMIRGNVRAFDQGYTDGFDGRAARVETWTSYADKGDYERGHNTGQKQAPNGTLRSIRKHGQRVSSH